MPLSNTLIQYSNRKLYSYQSLLLALSILSYLSIKDNIFNKDIVNVLINTKGTDINTNKTYLVQILLNKLNNIFKYKSMGIQTEKCSSGCHRG